MQTVYVLNGPKRQKIKSEHDGTQPFPSTDLINGEGLVISESNFSFLQLFKGQEPLDNVKLRYDLYSQLSRRQEYLSSRIMKDISSKILSDITALMNQPCKNHIDTAIFVPNSSISTSSSFLTQLDLHLRRSNKNFKTVMLNSKESTTIRQTLKTIVDAVVKEKDSYSRLKKVTDENLDSVYDVDSDSDAEYEDKQSFDMRLPFDLDIVEEWCERQRRKSRKDDVKVILIFEDIDSFSLGQLNRLLKLCYSFVGRIPLKFVFNVGTNLKSFIKKLNNEVSHFLKFTHFKIEQTDTIINRIVNEVIITEDYSLGEELTKFILDRFTNSIKTVDEFLKILKFAKMSFFYSNPLSIIASKLFKKVSELKLPSAYAKALRMLPSFRNYISSTIERNPSDFQEVQDLLTDDASLIELLKRSFISYTANYAHFKSVYKLSTEILSRRAFNREKNFLEIYYKLSSRDDFIRIQFLNELSVKLKENINTLSQIKDILKEIDEQSQNDDICQSLNSKLKLNLNFDEVEKFTNLDEKVKNTSDKLSLQYRIEFRKLKDSFFKTLDDFLKRNIKGDYRVFTFNEIFQFNDIDVIQTNLVPRYRHTLEESLINHEMYLGESQTGHPAVDRLNNSIDPILTSLYQIYRETTLHLNIFDYFTSFKYSLNREQIMKDLKEILDDESQVFENYLNDKRRFHFIYQFFYDMDIDEKEKWDKVALALFLQKCEELISCGFFKFLSKKKADVLEKAAWKDL